MESVEEAIRLLTPLFLRLPQALDPLMRVIRGAYLQYAQSAKAAPDSALLARVDAFLEKLDPPEEAKA
jgi:hypothetical protein